MSEVKIIIHTAPDGDYICAAKAAARLLALPDFKKDGIVIGDNGKAFYVCRNKSGSITIRGSCDEEEVAAE